jgi:hypothetical protein
MARKLSQRLNSMHIFKCGHQNGRKYFSSETKTWPKIELGFDSCQNILQVPFACCTLFNPESKIDCDWQASRKYKIIRMIWPCNFDGDFDKRSTVNTLELILVRAFRTKTERLFWRSCFTPCARWRKIRHLCLSSFAGVDADFVISGKA